MLKMEDQSRLFGSADRGRGAQRPVAPCEILQQPAIPANGAPPGSGPLGEGDFALIAKATAGYKVIRSAARTAGLSAGTTLTIGIFSVLFMVVWPSWEGALVAAGLCAVGLVEYWGHQRMLRADVAAAGLLAKNQMAFLGLIVLYCVAQMVMVSPEKIKAAALSPEVRSQLSALPEMQRVIDGDIDRYGPLITYGFYGLVIVLSVLFQGGLALYYFNRKKRLVEFHMQTPDWVRRVVIQSAG